MGEVFAGRYELVDPLGEGGMGTVWRAWDAKEERLVAAKVLRQSDAVSLLRFVREQAFRVVHPHVLTPLGWAGDDDRVLFTMPVVEGGSVASLVGDHGPLPPLLVAEVLRQLTSALDAVHAAGILHRDVKPANVLLAATGLDRPHAFLTDFGIAIELDGVRLTQTGQWTGTPSYSAPESQAGAEPHPTADLFAVGQVGIAMLTGERPVPSPTRPVGTPQELWSLLADLTAAEPSARPQSAAEVLRRLDMPVLAWRPGAMGEVEVLRHVPAPTVAQLSATADSPTRVPLFGSNHDDDATRVRPPSTVGSAGTPRPAHRPTPVPGAADASVRPTWLGRAPLVGGALAVAALVGVLLWSPWSGEAGRPGPGETPTTRPDASPVASASAAPSTDSVATPTPRPSPSTARGSVGVGTVVVSAGQPCSFTQVGVREQTVDGVDVVCSRRDDGSYAWAGPAR
ncbi:serine/threonine-protein kinase [Knoellia flava]|uniref:non-specific serine/threonine protein kinase n=1 Tax=Knoellia flava TaxID=913969 RepID=A0A8H9FX34_9MICO|nr:serine/threonine-protein kinase [Knoellia flava]GGB84144.1 hypothetical protein GCM10011314_24730 [Knoellia flava]